MEGVLQLCDEATKTEKQKKVPGSSFFPASGSAECLQSLDPVSIPSRSDSL
jgi:hypothetical protein